MSETPALLFSKFCKYCLLVFVALFSFSVASSFVRADFNEDYQKYLTIYDDYRSTHNKYLTTRSQYLTYGTLTSKNDALTAVKEFMHARTDVLVSYFGLLKQRNVDTAYGLLLDEEVNFVTTHKGQIDAVGSLDDAVILSDRLESRHTELQVISRKVVGTLVASKIESLLARSSLAQTDAYTLINTLRSSGKDVSVLERWILDAKSKHLLADQKLAQAKSEIAELESGNVGSLTEKYNQIQFTLFEANQYVRESIGLLTELSETIKYGDY